MSITKGKIHRKEITVEKQRFWNWKETSLENIRWFNCPFFFSSLCTFNVYGKKIFALRNASGLTLICDIVSKRQMKYINIITCGDDNEKFDKSFSFLCEFEGAPEEAKKFFFIADEMYNPGNQLLLYQDEHIVCGYDKIVKAEKLIVSDDFRWYRLLKFDSPRRYCYSFYVITPLLISKIKEIRKNDPFAPEPDDRLELQTENKKISVPVRITGYAMFNEDTFQRMTSHRYWYESPEVVMGKRIKYFL